MQPKRPKDTKFIRKVKPRNPPSSEPKLEPEVYITEEIIDSISILTGMSFGDIISAINDGNFDLIAIDALQIFREKYYQDFIGKIPEKIEENIEDCVIPNTINILKHCLNSILEDISNCNDPRAKRSLRKEAKDLRLQIEREIHGDSKQPQSPT